MNVETQQVKELILKETENRFDQMMRVISQKNA